jgi:hypothetical protein
MTPATTQGKDFALNALEARRTRNKDRPPFDNVSLPAESPMYFACISCGDDIAHPENYLIRVKLCGECQALMDLGWL